MLWTDLEKLAAYSKTLIFDYSAYSTVLPATSDEPSMEVCSTSQVGTLPETPETF